jgi:hypothetical protein
MIFVNKGDKPLTATQLEKRAQKYISRAFSPQAREESIRKEDGLFNSFMAEFSQDHSVNVENNTFNHQLVAYKNAVARLEKHVLLDGQVEVREMQPTGEQTFNEESGEMEDVLQEVVVKREIEPVDEFVAVTVYGDDPEAEPTVEQQRNPVVIQDEAEREQAQAIVDGTPEEVKTFEG